VNANSKDLARIAASVARESTSRASRVDRNEAQRNPSHSVRARLHGAMTIGLAIAVAVVAFKWSEERDLRRKAEARAVEVIPTHVPTTLRGDQFVTWPYKASQVKRVDTAGRAVAAPPSVPPATAAASIRRASDFQQQLRRKLSDPATRNAIRAQQRNMVIQIYGELLRSWHFSADKSDRVLDLLAEQQLREIDRSLAASDTPGQDASTRLTVGAHDADNDDLNALLTEAQRAQLSQQQATMSESATVSSLADELSLAQIPMTGSQQQQLIQIMYDERTAIPAPNVNNASANSPGAQSALDDWESALDQRVQDRAASILTDDQQTRFEQFMTRQHEARTAFASFQVAQAGDNPLSTAPPATSSP
jgi:hypothetical protein